MLVDQVEVSGRCSDDVNKLSKTSSCLSCCTMNQKVFDITRDLFTHNQDLHLNADNHNNIFLTKYHYSFWHLTQVLVVCRWCGGQCIRGQRPCLATGRTKTSSLSDTSISHQNVKVCIWRFVGTLDTLEHIVYESKKINAVLLFSMVWTRSQVFCYNHTFTILLQPVIITHTVMRHSLCHL